MGSGLIGLSCWCLVGVREEIMFRVVLSCLWRVLVFPMYGPDIPRLFGLGVDDLSHLKLYLETRDLTPAALQGGSTSKGKD